MLESRFEALALENRCISDLATEAEELPEKVAEPVEIDSAAKSTPNGRGRKTRYFC